MILRTWAVIACVVLLAGCGGPKPASTTASKVTRKPAPSTVKIEGDPSTDVNEVAIKALSDLQAFWSEQFPKLYDKGYDAVEGGFYALTPESTSGPECASSYRDVAGNAFYCSLDDSVAWDASGLLPNLKANYGEFVIPVAMAHEWGHAIQHRAGFQKDNRLTVSAELQADCFAGAWGRHAQDDNVFDVSSADLDRALAGVLDLRDRPGMSGTDRGAHGSGFDRVSAFQDGYDNGVERCKAYRDGKPTVLELPFNDAADEANEGNEPYASIVNGVPYDLEDFWAHAYPGLAAGAPWRPMKGVEPFDPSSPPNCGGQPAQGYDLFYCADDDYVGWDNVKTMPRIYQRAGDYAVATLLATQYGLAALSRLGIDDSDEKVQTLRADCLAGAYTASVILYDRKTTSTYRISPGDLDEGIKALLLFRGDGDVERQGAGFIRIRGFREGVLHGAQACLRYRA